MIHRQIRRNGIIDMAIHLQYLHPKIKIGQYSEKMGSKSSGRKMKALKYFLNKPMVQILFHNFMLIRKKTTRL